MIIKDILAKKHFLKKLGTLIFMVTANFTTRYLTAKIFWREGVHNFGESSEINLTIWNSLPHWNPWSFTVSLESKLTFWCYIKITWLNVDISVTWLSLLLSEESWSHPPFNTNTSKNQVNKIYALHAKSFGYSAKNSLLAADVCSQI